MGENMCHSSFKESSMSKNQFSNFEKLMILIKGEISLPTKGRLFYSRMWFKNEDDKICEFIENNNISIVFNLLEKSHGDISLAKEIHCPIKDYSIPKDKDLFLSCIDDIVKHLDDKNILVHCAGGRGRTGLAIATILWRLGYSKEEALRVTQDKVEGPETDLQIEFFMSL
jgi:protein-tyrosine phosphatase